jgi:glycosyltransferase involved in cell wall biosynthesis
LTRDEERNLPRALTSLPRDMNVFVLDAYSTDHTLQFARAAGAQVEQRRWTDFVDARRFAAEQVATPWTLMIDADEALDDVLREAIVAANDAPDGYVVRRTTYFCGRALRQWRAEPLLRLFRTGSARLAAWPATTGDAPLHEAWSSDGNVAELPGTLLHYSYPDAATYRAKYDRYTSLEAQRVSASPLKLIGACAVGLVRVAWLLLVRGALLDGPRGWYVAWHSAFYPAVVYGKALTG